MRIDYDRLIMLLLPLRLRQQPLVSLIKTLISPVVAMHDSFHLRAEKIRLRAAATPQALMLEQLVLMETGLSVKISPVETGASPDFEVKHPDNATAADVAAARSVIDRYKLAGKCYRVVGSSVPFSTAWSDFECSVSAITAVESADWTDKVCAVEAIPLPQNQIRLSQAGTIIKLYSSGAVTSSVTTVVHFSFSDNSSADYSFTISAGQTNSNQYTISSAIRDYWPTQVPAPASDLNWDYIFTME